MPHVDTIASRETREIATSLILGVAYPLNPLIASDRSSETDHDIAWFCSARCPESIEVAVDEYSKLDPPAAVAETESKTAFE